jgi:hypothetical protein
VPELRWALAVGYHDRSDFSFVWLSHFGHIRREIGWNEGKVVMIKEDELGGSGHS